VDKHSPEPWTMVKVYPSPRYGADFPYRVEAADQFSPCMIYGDGTQNRGTAEANAERIVACVNNLAGLNPKAIPQLAREVESLIRSADLMGTNLKGSTTNLRAALAKAKEATP